MNPQLEIARQIATEAHKGQFRRDGVTPYITHPEAVANAVSDAAKPVAWLHDVIEDTGVIYRDLINAGIANETVEAVYAITRRGNTPYEVYIDRVKRNPLAAEVKIADIEHNLSCDPKPEKVAKYRRALEILRS